MWHRIRIWVLLLLLGLNYSAWAQWGEGGAWGDIRNYLMVLDTPIIPVQDATFDLGTASLRFKDIYASGTVTGTLSGNATTATALAANPTDCSSTQFATSIAANGNLGCAAITDADVPNDITITESDPQVGTLTSGKLCTNNGTTVECTQDQYTAGDHITLTGADFDVDDDFLLNTGDTGSGDYTLSGYLSTENFTISKHYTGFPDRTATSLSWSDAQYTLTLTATTDPIWINGVSYDINTLTKQLSVAQEAASGLYWFWITAPGGTPQLNVDTTHPGFDVAIVATVYWNTTTNKGLLADERHWMGRDQWWHEYTHETMGARYASGMAGTYTDTTVTIGLGEFYDEDIEHTNTQQTTVRVLYHNGDADWVWDTITTPYKVVNPGVDDNLRYNNGNALATVDNNKYVNSWIFITGDTTYPVHVVIGTAQYATIALARAATLPSLGSLASAESKIIYKVTYQNNGGTPDYIEATDYRSSSNLPVTSYVATDHGSLAGLTDDDHTQYLLVDGTRAMTGDLTVSGGDITLGTSSIFSGGDTASLNNVDAVDSTTESTIEAAIDTLSNLSGINASQTNLTGGTGVDINTNDVVFDATELGNITYGDSSLASLTITSALSGATDPTLQFGNNMITVSNDLTITGDDLYMGTNTSGMLLIADGTNFNPTAMSSDATITSAGAITIADNAVLLSELGDPAAASSLSMSTYNWLLSFSSPTSGPPTPIFSDSFTGSDGSLNGVNGWNNYNNSTAVFINSNTVRRNANPGGPSLTIQNGTTPPTANYYVQADVTCTNTSDMIGVMARATYPGYTTREYYVCYANCNSDNFRLDRFISNSQTVLDTYSVDPGVTTHTIKLTVNGSALTCHIDGTQRLSATDANITATRSGGLIWETNFQTGYADNFEMGGVAQSYDGALDIQSTGAYTGDLVHIEQASGNPSTVNLLTLQTADADVTPLYVAAATANVGVFEGTTADNYETILAITDPTSADKTITFPNATGTVAVTATAPATLSAAGDIGISSVIKTDTKCYRLKDPTDAMDDKSIWMAELGAITLTKLWCESDQTVTAMLQVDDGSPADVDSVDMTCDSTPPEDTSLDGDATMAAGDRLDLDIASTADTPTWFTMCWTYTKD